MHRYNNSVNYGFTSVRSVFKANEPKPMYDEPVLASPQQTTDRVRRYLPGERLLKKLGKQEEKKKPLNMAILEKSISEIWTSFKLVTCPYYFFLINLTLKPLICQKFLQFLLRSSPCNYRTGYCPCECRN